MQESVATPPVSAGAVGAPKTSPRLGHIGGQSQGPDRRGGVGAEMALAHAHDRGRGRGAVVTASRTGTVTRAAARAGSAAAGGDGALQTEYKVPCNQNPLAGTYLAQDVIRTDA